MKSEIKKSVTPYDYLLTVLLVIFSTASMAPMKKRMFDKGQTAVILYNGSPIRFLPLYQDQIVHWEGMVFQVENDHIRVAKSDCPHGICTKSGWISRPAQTIVCVPNRILIEIQGRSENGSLNAVSY